MSSVSTDSRADLAGGVARVGHQPGPALHLVRADAHLNTTINMERITQWNTIQLKTHISDVDLHGHFNHLHHVECELPGGEGDGVRDLLAEERLRDLQIVSALLPLTICYLPHIIQAL